MINKIQIKNVKKHKFLELDLHEGINLITGPTGSGKSIIFDSLEFVMGFSSVRFEDLLREGEKELYVKIWYDNGFQVERIRSISVNRYILSKDGEDKIFDSIGKSVPEEVQKILNILPIEVDGQEINLNFAQQDNLNFLLDSSFSETFKSKLFNVLTGSDLIDLMFKKYNKVSLSTKKEIDRLESSAKKQEEQLAELNKEYKLLKSKLDNVSKIYESLVKKNEHIEKLRQLIVKIDEHKEKVELLNFQKSKIKVISQSTIDSLEKKYSTLQNYSELQKSIENWKQRNEQLQIDKQSIKKIDVDFDKLMKKAEELKIYKELINRIEIHVQNSMGIKEKMLNCQKNITKAEVELQNIWKEVKYCPLCDRSM